MYILGLIIVDHLIAAAFEDSGDAVADIAGVEAPHGSVSCWQLRPPTPCCSSSGVAVVV